MTQAMKNSLAALVLALTLTPVMNAAGPRLLAYYEFSDQFNVPPYNASTIPYEKLTHIIHSNIAPSVRGDGSLYIPKGFVEPQLLTRAHAAGVKVELCVSGAAGLFVKIDADPAARATFAQNIAKFAIGHGYDGVDFDYEVPHDLAQAEDFTALIKNVRALMPAGQYIISAAVPSAPNGSWGVFDLHGMTPLLDFFNVMTYDFHGAWTNHSGHNSPLYLSPLDPGQDGSLDTSTTLYVSGFKVPAEKINLGTAFYGYAFDVYALWAFCADNNLCGAAGAPSLTYAQIAQLINSGAWSENIDDMASAPYLLDASSKKYGFITYDTAASTTMKVDYALSEKKLGGVFMWELSQDYNGQTQPLLDAMHEAFIQAGGR